MGSALVNVQDALKELGARLQRERLNRNLTQAEIAARAGVGVRTVRYLEAGRTTTVETMLRVLQALDKLEAFAGFLPAPGLSPIQLAKLRGRERKRAGRPRRQRGGEKD